MKEEIAEKIKVMTQFMRGHTQPAYVELEEYKNFVDAYRSYLKSLNAVRSIRFDIKDVQGEYHKLKADHATRLKKNDPVMDPLEFQSKVSEFDRQLRELRKTETECEQHLFSEQKTLEYAYRTFADVFDKYFIRPLVEKRKAILNDLEKTDSDLHDVLTAWNDKRRIVLEDSGVPKIEISKKNNIELIDLQGYDAWRDATQID